MLESTDLNQIPRIGTPVHYYPNNFTRLAAFVCDTHPLSRDAQLSVQRPNCNLAIFNADGTLFRKLDVPAFDINDQDPNLPRAGTWSFPDEIATLQDSESENFEAQMGSIANLHVGNLTY